MPPRSVNAENNKYSFTSIDFNFAGKTVTEINTLSYADTINRAFVYGTSPYAIARTSGVYMAGGSVAILKERDSELVAEFGDGWARLNFNATISFTEIQADGSEGPLVTDYLESCAWASAKDSMKYGPDPLYVERDFTIIKIIRNGVKPY